MPRFLHVSEAHLARYLAEFDFRYNHRSGPGIEDTERTNELLRDVAGKRLKHLIGVRLLVFWRVWLVGHAVHRVNLLCGRDAMSR
jgi:hypothetical protein